MAELASASLWYLALGDGNGGEGLQRDESIVYLWNAKMRLGPEKKTLFWISPSENKVNQGSERKFHKIPERSGGGSFPGAVFLLGRHTASTKMNKMNLKYELVNARRREA
ncbi:hypothetical protein B0H14DRAFT_2582155 [Mycena olivaceomarginata]|nr:hypothetical protein B0H14DRAFT_2582155 [Mycena olivaceomarginata]